jgi:predicted S18 family serine protease
MADSEGLLVGSNVHSELCINHRRSNMKKVLTTLALLTVIATPAFAQTTKHEAMKSYARAPIATSSQNDIVVEGGKVIGQDPDANVRLELRREGASAQ